jgi:TonB family protein
MNGVPRPWSAEAHPVSRLGLAIAASAALHAGVMPSLAAKLGGPGTGAASAQPLYATLTVERERPRPRAERDAPFPPAGGNGASMTSASAPGIPVVEDARYFTAAELDHSPTPLMPIEPRYPAGAGGRAGRVVLNLFIDRDGRVDKIVLVSGDRPFDESALRAFAETRYSPGVRHGATVKSQMVIEVTYLPEKERTDAVRADGS